MPWTVPWSLLAIEGFGLRSTVSAPKQLGNLGGVGGVNLYFVYDSFDFSYVILGILRPQIIWGSSN